ncbi:hypothetical protein RISK_004764 [Rhodopirellula islandica]|uniref:Uncharacterized protein n=1 Tax=Rhodopirellula islandica TaxID=595434 RepID=A0A0J1B9Q6_RHOIS|nr:hypothetical protein RISK_004764 [Rhodopirellula islandica]
MDCDGKRHCSQVQPGPTPKRLTWFCPILPADLLMPDRQEEEML